MSINNVIKRQSATSTRWKIWLTLGTVLCLVAPGCKQKNSKNNNEENSDTCVDNEQFFKDEVWAPILSQKCMLCHNSTGEAKDSNFVLVGSWWGPGYLEKNRDLVADMIKDERDGVSRFLLKPANEIDHKGGMQIDPSSDDYATIEDYIERLENPEDYTCPDDSDELRDKFFENVVMLDEVQTLRKATLSLTGRLPTRAEEQSVRDGGFAALDKTLDAVMTEPNFFLRLKEILNDNFLTDRYIENTRGIDLLDGEQFPNAYWFDNIEDEDEQRRARSFSNQAVAQDALELAVYLVRNQRPFTEIVTADYMVVNPYSAQVYNVGATFADASNPDEFVPVQLPGIPHAGVLTSPMFLNRFPTTPTNRNRHRAKIIYKFFLATDVEALASRPIDPTSIADHNPTMNNPNCVICHSNIDPVAGALQNWDEMGRYGRPDGGWFPDMLQPGFGDSIMPANEAASATRWLGNQLIQDRRFSTSIVSMMYKGLTGQDPLTEPADSTIANFLGLQKAHEIQSEIFSEIGEKFADSDYLLTTVIKEIIKSPYYRADNAEKLDAAQSEQLSELGTGRLLTPEQLHRKIEAVTGYPWRPNVDAQDYLLERNWYQIFYGGIDSDSVVERITEPNGIMANVAQRMANEMACWTTARDFSQDPADRILFPYVELAYEPEDENEFVIPAVADAIRANLQYLHQRLLGEYLEIDDQEINRSYGLFVNVWKDGKLGLESGEYQAFLDGSCRATRDYWTGEELPDNRRIESDEHYTLRAWMSVLTYMLSDYRFLHE